MAVTFTQEQQETIDARNASVLVSAAAGSGKTAVLVERIIRMVSDPDRPVDIDRLLVVTFTNAAAAQMRERISQALSGAVDENPQDAHLARQLTLIHNAQITTIDSFCLYIIRNHFDEIDLDPDFRVADEGEIRLMKQDVLHDMLEEYFQKDEEDFRSFVEFFAPLGNEKRLEEQILSLYEFAMSYPWPEEWLEEHKKDYDLPKEGLDACGFVRRLKEYIRLLLSEAERLLEQNRRLCQRPDGAYMYLDALEADEELIRSLKKAESLQELYEGFGNLTFARLSSKKDASVSEEAREEAKELRQEFKDMLQEIGKKYFYASPESQKERMEACAPQVAMLLSMTEDFCARLAEQKRKKNVLDFHDMEHLALQILTRREGGQVVPTRTAVELRDSYAEIMIDEYQDSNLVQEFLLKSVSTEEEGRYNRFMVGDVKQSIYKFRLARPELFMEKFDSYAHGDGSQGAKERRIDLKKNFRSRRQVTENVNQVFSRLMGKDLGGVAYDADAALYPGAVYKEPEREEGMPDPYLPEALLAVAGEDGMEDREREALMVAGRIRELVGTLPVTDDETGELRPAEYRDIVILLRATSGWDETFRKVLEEYGIPVYLSSKTGYFAATEVQTVLNYLKILNNPLQDIPLFGVLHSPVGGFTDQEIARIRAGRTDKKLYDSLTEYAQAEAQEDRQGGEEAGPVQAAGERVQGAHALVQKARSFLEQLSRFRSYVAYMPIHKLIEEFLQETGYLYMVSALPGGQQRCANVQMLLSRAESFEKTSYFGLFHFIRYMEQLEKYDVDYGEASLQDENADAVRIMSIHKSKGLEFPVCFVCGLGKRFNMQDTAKPVIADMDMGLGVEQVDSRLRIKRNTLKKNVMAGKLRQDSLGEELRVLYVAMTRAKEKLILTGSCKAERAEKLNRKLEAAGEKCNGEPALLLPFYQRVSASCYLDWLLPAWLDCGQQIEQRNASQLLTDQVRKGKSQEQLRLKLKQFAAKEPAYVEKEEEEIDNGLKERLESVYPHTDLEGLYVKTTVSELKKAGMKEAAEEAYHLFEEEEPVPYLPKFIQKEVLLQEAKPEKAKPEKARPEKAKSEKAGPEESRQEEAELEAGEETGQERMGQGPGEGEAGTRIGGAARGSAYHKALELFDFAEWFGLPQQERTRQAVADRLEAMERQGRLSAEYRAAIFPGKFLHFLESSLAARMGRAARAGRLHREQPFVLGLSAAELSPSFPEEETVLVQGIIDVWLEEEDGLVLADYKTDAVKRKEELLNRYRVQLRYYARALEQLTGKRVKEKLLYSFALQQEISEGEG